MAHVLIVAYGNPLRCDDGLAWRAADVLEGKLSGGEVEILRTHQLAPEFAETITGYDAVIFVDAACGDGPPGEVRCRQIGLPEDAPRFSHQLSPAAVVALAHQLFGAFPPSYSLTLTGACFDHGESLSPVVEAALPALVARMEVLLQECLLPEAFPASMSGP